MPDATATYEQNESVRYCQEKIAHFGAKANKKKADTLRLFSLVVLSTVSSPLFITMGDGTVVGKLIPSVLCAVAAMCATWLQLRRPQQQWAVFRTAQRELEDQLARHRFRFGDYATEEKPDALLASQVARVTLAAHQQWATMVPKSEEVERLLEGAPKAQREKQPPQLPGKKEQ